jgi:hypothetical protein
MPARPTVPLLVTSLFLFFSGVSRVQAQVSVAVAPASVLLTAGESARFSSMVSGAHNTGVNWSIAPAVGTLSNGYYVAPTVITTPLTVTLSAISMQDPSKTGSAIISLMPSSGMALSAALLTVVPSFAVLQAKDTIALNALLNGTSTQAIQWSIAPPVGSITTNGIYQAPNPINSAQTVIVTATSNSNPNNTAKATISLLPQGAQAADTTGAVTVTVSPASSTLKAGQSARFSAVVGGTRNTAVSWSISPALGMISNGYYVAPSTINSPQTVMLIATSMADATRSASVPIFLLADAGAAPAAATGSSQPVSVSVQLSPVSVSLASGQARQFSATVSGSQNTSVTWSVVPAIGSVVNGVYTAPATISSQMSVTLMATSVADPSKTASAAILLQSNPVSISLSPSSVWLTHGQSTQFSAAVNGTSNTGVTWSLAPAVGSIANGFYTAPASVLAQQTVTVTATSMADPTKSAKASITLAPVSITLVPASITLAAGASSRFSANVSGTLNTGVSWSVTPAVGTVVNGLYTAPTTVSTAQSLTLTATSLADPTQIARATISLTPNVSSPSSLSVFPNQVSLTPSQVQQFAASGSGGIGGSGPVSVQWSINPAVGSITSTGLYTAPSTVSAQQNVNVVATGSAGSASAVVTLTPSGNSQSQSAAIQLPLEIMGSAGTTVPVTFNVAPGSNLSGQLQLWLQIHGLKYETEASVQINSSAWIPINTSTVVLQGNSAKWGGIGGGFATLKLTLNLPPGSIITGNNTLLFRFNGTDGITSGFRVLNLNVLSAGVNLIPQSSFTWDDPSTWQPPLNNSADIQAGEMLWKTASLATVNGPIHAHCGDCHTQDGRDLKYFNYSNYSIRVRSMFHGLTAQQGDQIASYIRSLNTPAPANARPWNPPYQPGPGLDSQPVANWAAGAGLDGVLDTDAEMLPYLMPGGSMANLGYNGYVNAREIPVSLQLPDWNHWLPTIHPMDAFGSTFTTSPLYQNYLQLRADLTSNNASAYSHAVSKGDFAYLLSRLTDLDTAVQQPTTSPSWQDPNYVRAYYSTRLWAITKMWEVNQEFGLEGMAQAAFGARAVSARAWFNSIPFATSPFMSRVPRPSPGLANGTAVAHTYFSFAWYQLQLILNDGNGTAVGTWPIDWAYSLSYLSSDLPWDASTAKPRVGTAGLLLEWSAKGLQNGNPIDSSPGNMTRFPGQVSSWIEVSPSQKLQELTGWTTTWLAGFKRYTPQQITSSWDSGTVVRWQGIIAGMLPQLRYQGVDINLLNQVVQAAAVVWPGINWASFLNQTCTVTNLSEVKCQ